MLDEYPLDYYHPASFLRPSGLLGDRGCATSRVRVELLSGADGVSRCVKSKRGSLQETQGDSVLNLIHIWAFSMPSRGGGGSEVSATVAPRCRAAVVRL